MDTITFVTGNSGKFLSATRHLEGYGIRLRSYQLDFPEPRSNDVGVIAKEKARYASGVIEGPLFAVDAGFYIPSLNGFPGPYVNYVLGTIGTSGILRLAEGTDRECEFREALAYIGERPGEATVFDAVIKGRIAEQPRGENHPWLWSALGTIFIPHGHHTTLGELTREQYEEWSRWKKEETSCFVKFGKWYVETYGSHPSLQTRSE